MLLLKYSVTEIRRSMVNANISFKYFMPNVLTSLLLYLCNIDFFLTFVSSVYKGPDMMLSFECTIYISLRFGLYILLTINIS